MPAAPHDQIFDLEPRNFAGRFILLIFSFMMLVLTAVYTGSTGAPCPPAVAGGIAAGDAGRVPCPFTVFAEHTEAAASCHVPLLDPLPPLQPPT